MPNDLSEPTIKRLEPNSLYIFLYRHPNPKIRFHWALYHHANGTDGGWKFDIITPNGFWAVAVSYNGVPRPNIIEDERWPLGCAVKLGRLDVEGSSCPTVHKIIRQEDGELNDVDAKIGWSLSCKVYVQRACARLVENKLLSYPNWERLEEEVLQTGGRCEKEPEVLIVDSAVAHILT